RTEGHLALELLLRAGDGIALVVEQFLDPADHVELFLGVDPLTGLALARREHRELGLPIAQDVGLDIEGAAGFADLVVQLLVAALHALSVSSRSWFCRPAAQLAS